MVKVNYFFEDLAEEWADLTQLLIICSLAVFVYEVLAYCPRIHKHRPHDDEEQEKAEEEARGYWRAEDGLIHCQLREPSEEHRQARQAEDYYD